MPVEVICFRCDDFQQIKLQQQDIISKQFFFAIVRATNKTIDTCHIKKRPVISQYAM